MSDPQRVLVFGATGMLGHVLLRVLSEDGRYQVAGTIRDASRRSVLPPALAALPLHVADAAHPEQCWQAIEAFQPHCVVNCVGLVKQLLSPRPGAAELAVNAAFPHQLRAWCESGGARLVHVSTDCVFSGTRGAYREDDVPDATDAYGRSKLEGEPAGPRTLALRTSIVGPELGTRHGLLEWFLGERSAVRGFRRSVFSGLTTRELSQVMRDAILPREDLAGLYHVAAEPINKYEFLQLVKTEYGLDTPIAAEDATVIDRSLDARRFQAQTGYAAPPWGAMIRDLRVFSRP